MKLTNILASFTLLGLSHVSVAQTNTTEIWLVDISIIEGKPTAGTPLRITDNNYYDNQPSFSKDGNSLYFSSMPDTVQNDIYEYNIRKKLTRQVTNTPESEFQPQVIPNSKDRFSFVRMEMNKSQTLMSARIDGTDAQYLMDNEDSVAYYCWMNDTTVGAFMLNGAGGLLEQYDLKPQQAIIIMQEGFGRCLANIPGTNNLSYVKKNAKGGHQLMKFEMETQDRFPITLLPEGVEDYCWGPENRIYCAVDGILKYIDTSDEKNQWTTIADFTKITGNFYRMAMSKEGNRLAIVTYKGAKP
jgi:hypothetical protein